MSVIYKKIKERREKLGMSQDELAKKMGYKSRSSINKIETGENDIPQSKVEAFAKALETTTAYLLGLENEPVNDYLYALNAETQELTDENKAKLLEMARFFKQQQDKE